MYTSDEIKEIIHLNIFWDFDTKFWKELVSKDNKYPIFVFKCTFYILRYIILRMIASFYIKSNMQSLVVNIIDKINGKPRYTLVKYSMFPYFLYTISRHVKP